MQSGWMGCLQVVVVATRESAEGLPGAYMGMEKKSNALLNSRLASPSQALCEG